MADHPPRTRLPIPDVPYEGALPLDAKDPDASFPPIEPLRPPAGCPFHPRCPHAVEKCRELVPALEEYIPSQVAACIRVPELMGQGSGTVMKG